MDKLLEEVYRLKIECMYSMVLLYKLVTANAITLISAYPLLLSDFLCHNNVLHHSLIHDNWCTNLVLLHFPALANKRLILGDQGVYGTTR